MLLVYYASATTSTGRLDSKLQDQGKGNTSLSHTPTNSELCAISALASKRIRSNRQTFDHLGTGSTVVR